nr:NAD(P)/FAD-dependent oxidoreductase [Spirosomataceae bacterium]
MTGLAAAYIATKQGVKVTVIEGSDKFGGLLNTFEIGGNQLEHYYHHFFTQDAELRWMLEDLGIADKTFFKKTTMGVFRNGKIYDFNSPIDLLKFKPVGIIGKIRFGLTSLFLGKIAKWPENEGVPTLDWFYKWAGKDITDALWKPMLDIKFGPYAKQVPLAWMIGRLAQRLNSRKGGDERLGYISGSWKTLMDRLVSKLQEMGVELIKNEPVTEFKIENNQLMGIKTKNQTIEGGKFLVTIPQIYINDLLKDKLKTGKNIEYFGAVCTILELKKSFSNIYWMNVADAGFPFGGVIEHTNFIPKEEYNGSHIVYLSRYFAMTEDLANMTEEQIKERMIPPLKKINPAFSEDWIKNVYVFKTNVAATVCDLNFSEKVPSCKTEIDNLYLANMAHIYPDERSTNNSIRVAAEACQVMGINTDFVPYGASLSGKIGFNR